MNRSSLSEMDYAEQVAFANNVEVETLDPSLPVNNTALLYNFIFPPFQLPHVCNKKIPTPASNGITHILSEPSPPTVIPYSANVPADPSL